MVRVSGIVNGMEWNPASNEKPMKYILVTGGVISGVGKGIISSSLGVLLKNNGYKVSAIKIDPYLNIDAGTFSPYEHVVLLPKRPTYNYVATGEVFVLDDGGEVDLDLGNYERFLNVRLTRDNNITTGKMFQHVTERERRGDYCGKTVQMIPHFTDAIIDWVERVARIPVDGSSDTPDVCIIELGGTIGDIEGMSYLAAFERFQRPALKAHLMNVHVSLIMHPNATGEPKTKPMQNSVRHLRAAGLVPDLLICRSSDPLQLHLREKIAAFGLVDLEQVICYLNIFVKLILICKFKKRFNFTFQVIGVHDVSNIYRVPLLLQEQNVLEAITRRLHLSPIEPIVRYNLRFNMSHWTHLSELCDSFTQEVTIALIGKYVKIEDAYASVNKALSHAAIHSKRKLRIKFVDSELLEKQDENMAAWETVKNAEYNYFLTMDAILLKYLPISLGKLYGKNEIEERHRHRYEVNPRLVTSLSKKGLLFVGMGVDETSTTSFSVKKRTESSAALMQMAGSHPDNEDLLSKISELCQRGGDGVTRPAVRMEICEMKDHPYFVGAQFHPEYLSHPLQPSPPFLGLLLAASGQLEDYRFMAVNDLMRDLQANTMHLDDDSERKVIRMLVKLLQDNNGEVQNLSVKCLGTVTQRIKEAQADTLVDALCSLMVSGTEAMRDVSSIALKTVISNLPPISISFTANLVKRLMPKLTQALGETKPTDSVRLEILDIIGDVLLRFGASVQPVHQDVERQALRKRATVALGYMTAVCTHELFNEIVQVLIERLSTAKNLTAVRTYVVAITYVTKSSGSRFAEHLPMVVPLFLQFLRTTEDDELREAVLQGLEAFLYRCPREIATFQDDIQKVLTINLSHDPNYSYDDEEDMENSMEVEGDEQDDDEGEDYSDDDDMSWKVRRAAAKAIEAMIVSRRDQLATSFSVIGPLLISRLKEREESVRADVFSAYIALLTQARIVVPNTLNSVWVCYSFYSIYIVPTCCFYTCNYFCISQKDGDPDPALVIGPARFSSSAFSHEQQTILEALSFQVDPLLKAVINQIKQKCPKTRLLCFELLSNLVRALPCCLASSFSNLLPGLASSLSDKASSAQMKIDALFLLSRTIQSHDPQVFTAHLSEVVTIVIGAINEGFYKVSAEGLVVASQLVTVLKHCGDNQFVPLLYEAVYRKLQCTDIDQEVKERAIATGGHFIACFGDVMDERVTACLLLLLERMRNEMTRLSAVRALSEVVLSSTPVDLSAIIESLLPILADFLKKNVRALKIGTLHLIESLLSKDNIAGRDSDGLSQNCLVGLSGFPSRVSPHLPSILTAVVELAQSALLQGATLTAVLDMVRILVSQPVPGKPGFEELLDQLTAPVYDVSNLPRQAFHSISSATAVVASASGDVNKARILAGKLANHLRNPSSTDAIRLFSLHALGELGRRCPQVYVQGKVEPEHLIVTAFNSSSEDLKAAAAQALGALAVGNHEKFLPFILNEIQTQPKRQYLLLHALKEVIGWESAEGVSIDVFRSRISEVWPVLITHADGQEEGTRNVVAECLGKLCVIDPQCLLPKLKSLVTSPSSFVRSAVVTAVKFMISDEKRAIDVELQGCIGEFMQTMTDADLNVRRVALVVLNSAAHNKPSLIRGLLDILLPSIYSETKVRKELIREVEMGPFKHQVDDGLDLRKAAFEW
uniref:CTP synthase n=1 Tax=Heterorhabditis bacteriophora TaxID=37862 RepID=A0A1I7XN03_HETBA